MKNFHALRVLLSVAMLMVCSISALAQTSTYPQKPVRIVVPFPAGGPSDILSRVIGQKLAERLGQPVLIDNRAGANTIIGADLVAKAAPDGYTLLMAADNTLTMNQALYKKLPYDPFQDFEPIAKVAIAPLILVTSSDGPANVKALIAQAKANPGKLNYGFGTVTTQLAGEMIRSLIGLDLSGISYKGSSPTVQGLLSNDVNFILDGVPTALPHIQSGKLRAVAGLGSKRIAVLPDLPTLATDASLPGFDVSVWMGLAAPRGTPQAITTLISTEVARIVEMPDVKEKLEGVGLMVDFVPSIPFRSFLQSESAKWKKVITNAHIEMQ